VFWMETSEKLLVEELSHFSDLPNAENMISVRHSVSKALELAEQTFSFLSVEWLSQMLVVMTDHWEYGEKLYEDLSYMEKRLVQQAIAMKIAELQAIAAQESDSASMSTEV